MSGFGKGLMAAFGVGTGTARAIVPSLPVPPPAAPPSALQTLSGSIADATKAAAVTRKRLAAGVPPVKQPIVPGAFGSPNRKTLSAAPTSSLLGSGY